MAPAVGRRRFRPKFSTAFLEPSPWFINSDDAIPSLSLSLLVKSKDGAKKSKRYQLSNSRSNKQLGGASDSASGDGRGGGGGGGGNTDGNNNTTHKEKVGSGGGEGGAIHERVLEAAEAEVVRGEEREQGRWPLPV